MDKPIAFGKLALMIGCVVFTVARAENPAGCDYEIEPGQTSLRVVTLSASAYACMTESDYRDVQIVNGDGNSVPLYVTHPSTRSEHVDYRKSLNYNLDDVDTNRRNYQHLRYLVRRTAYDNNGPAYETWAQRHNYPATIIAENPDTRGRLNRLLVELGDGREGDVTATVYLEYSNDLSRWTSSSKPQKLFYKDQQSSGFTRKQLSIGGNRHARYIRIIVLSNIPDFSESITRLEGEYERTQFSEPEYAWTEATSIQMLNNGQDWQFSVPDQLPVSRLRIQPGNGIVYYRGVLSSKPIRLELPEDNAYLGVRGVTKQKLKKSLKRIVKDHRRSFESMNSGWHSPIRFEQVFIDSEPGESNAAGSTSPEPVSFPHRASRHWRIQFEHPSSAMIETQFPRVEFGWTAARVRFLAQGPEPFVLQTGISDQPPRARTPGILRDRSTSYESVALLAPDEVPVKDVHAEMAAAQADAESAGGGLDKQSIVWMILIAGVLVMAYMAWQLLRSIDANSEEER